MVTQIHVIPYPIVILFEFCPLIKNMLVHNTMEMNIPKAETNFYRFNIADLSLAVHSATGFTNASPSLMVERTSVKNIFYLKIILYQNWVRIQLMYPQIFFQIQF